MIAKFGKIKKRESKIGSILMILVALVLAGALIYLAFFNTKIYQKKEMIVNQVQLFKNQIDDLKENNASLKEKIEHVGDNEYIEKVAREELSLQKEGENVVAFIMPETKQEEINYWQPKGWWNFIKNTFNLIKSKTAGMVQW